MKSLNGGQEDFLLNTFEGSQDEEQGEKVINEVGRLLVGLGKMNGSEQKERERSHD